MDKNGVFTAMILAAGRGSRMQSEIKKQYLKLCGEWVVVHSIRAFELNPFIDHIVLVVPKDETSQALEMCISKHFRKICAITEGGVERFISVYNGILQIPEDTDYVLIHDGSRPLVSQKLISSCCKNVSFMNACIAALPLTDTIKKVGKEGLILDTPDRKNLYAAQTPQAFSFPLLKNAYSKLYKVLEQYGTDSSKVTDDSVVVENMTDVKVKIIPGDERNIKITTPTDMIVAEAFLKSMKE